MSHDKPEGCRSCVGWGWGTQGFVPVWGAGEVLMVGEAAGAGESESGNPFTGKAGLYMFSQLKRAGIDRERFTVTNVLQCRPPGNKLAGEPWEAAAIEGCSSNLRTAIETHKEVCKRKGLHPVVLSIGQISFKALLDIKKGDPILSEDYYNYVLWSPKFEVWVVNAPHPSFLMRGNHHLLPCLLFAATRCLQIAQEGFKFDEPTLHLDPEPAVFASWVEGYKRALAANPKETFLSVDIETPRKAKKGEDKLVREDDEDYIIQRVSFAYQPDEAVSVRWAAPWLPSIEDLLNDSRNQLVGWNLDYDLPRLRDKIKVQGTICDGMNWWHVLQSSLDKGLGFVTPYFWPGARVWKHLGTPVLNEIGQPEPSPYAAKYNALDALAALINVLGIRKNLQTAGQWPVVERHVVQLGEVLTGMSRTGVLRDEVLRTEAEGQLTVLLDAIELKISEALPEKLRYAKIFTKKPKNAEDDGVVQRRVPVVVKRCSNCGLLKPTKPHLKTFKRKENPCGGANVVVAEEIEERWVQPWRISNVSLQAYQKLRGQQLIWNRQRGTPTFDENAIRDLRVKYPDDPLYPLIVEQRQLSKLLGTYIGVTDKAGVVQGGLRIGRDGRIHPEYTSNPSTLRLSCQNPNMQNLPRAGKAEDLETIVRNLVVASPGCVLLEMDYAAIEAVLTSYFAGWPDGIRLAKLGVHSYLASFVLGRPADLKWSDEDLRAYFKEIKGSSDPKTKHIYNACKRTIHLSNYGGTPRKMVIAEPDTFTSVRQAEELQGRYFEVAAPVRKWHLQTQLDAHQSGWLQNPWGYRLHLHRVFHMSKENGEWVRKPGEQANEALAFMPQSSAAAIIKDAMLRLWFERFEEVGQYLRLQVHDSLVCEVPKERLEEVQRVMREEMTRPILELPLPASYNLGPHLVIDVDVKSGEKWGSLA